MWHSHQLFYIGHKNDLEFFFFFIGKQKIHEAMKFLFKYILITVHGTIRFT